MTSTRNDMVGHRVRDSHCYTAIRRAALLRFQCGIGAWPGVETGLTSSLRQLLDRGRDLGFPPFILKQCMRSALNHLPSGDDMAYFDLNAAAQPAPAESRCGQWLKSQ